MEQVLAGPAPLARQLLVGADDAVADGALSLALQGAHDIPAPRDEAVDQVAIREGDDALAVAQPGLPLLLGHGDAIDALDDDGRERVGGRQPDDDGHKLLVDLVAGRDFLAALVDLDGQGFVGGCVILAVRPLADGAERGCDDVWGDETLRPTLHGEHRLTRFAVDPP